MTAFTVWQGGSDDEGRTGTTSGPGPDAATSPGKPAGNPANPTGSRLPNELMADALRHPGEAGPEGRYLSGAGKPVHRRFTEVLDRARAAKVTLMGARRAADRAYAAMASRRASHRGGERPWLLRVLILVGGLAEVGTAYVAMEVLVASVLLASTLSALTSAIGVGLACMLANRRLNHQPVPVAARILEAAFVLILTALRWESLTMQEAGLRTAAGGAALAALISALGLLGIEEIIFETQTLGLFLSGQRLAWKRWRYESAARRLARAEARIGAAEDRLYKHYLEYLLKSEGATLGHAQQRARALATALTDEREV